MTTANDIGVLIDSAGQLGTVSSSQRYKEDIADMASASSPILRLRPVTFRYRQPFADGSKPLQYGLVAEGSRRDDAGTGRAERRRRSGERKYHELPVLLLTKCSASSGRNRRFSTNCRRPDTRSRHCARCS